MSLDVFQQVFYLSFTSNLVSNLKGDQTSLQREFQVILEKQILPVVPGWELVWGPVVWKNEPDNAATGPDNSWYIAYNPSFEFEDGSVHPTYVVAIAGTPPESEYVWINQSFLVNQVTDFNAWVAGGIQNEPQVVPPEDIMPDTPYIAKGTVDALHILLSNAAPDGTAAPGTTIVDFLANLDTSDGTRIIVGGLSLGGALSASLTLALVSTGVIPADNTLNYLGAAPSPGNRDFTDLFTSTFPIRRTAGSKSYQGWNINMVNTLDIVPQAWAVHEDDSPEQNLGNIPSIYGTPVLQEVLDFTVFFGNHALSSGVRYFPLHSHFFTGPPPSKVPESVTEFLGFAGPQHVTAYINEAGVTIPSLDKSEVRRAGLREKTKDEIRFNYPIISGFEWGREHPAEARKEIEKVEGTAVGKALLDEYSSRC